MAQLRTALQRGILTTIFGNRLGLDQNDYLQGPLDYKRVVTDLTSASTGTAIPAYGITNITGTSLLTSAQTFLLSNPVVGVEVTIVNVNANSSAASPGSTGLTMIRPSTAFVILSTDGSTNTTINLTAAGAAITLLGLSTGVYQVTSRMGTSAAALINGTT